MPKDPPPFCVSAIIFPPLLMSYGALLFTIVLSLSTPVVPSAEARKPVICRIQQTGCHWDHPPYLSKRVSILRCRKVRVCR